MKAFVLSFTTLCLLAAVRGHVDYNLKCSKEEIGIRWPSYHSNSDYYVCQRVGGRQVKLSCEDGQLFTFVLQACTAPNRFIPPPPMDVLPTAAPTHGHYLPSHMGMTPGVLLQPHHHNGGLSAIKPPMHPNEHPSNWEAPLLSPPHKIDIDASSETGFGVNFVESGEVASAEKPAVPSKPVVKVPMPPTPAPTPPALKPPKKTPQLPNKKTPNAPSKSKATIPGKKQPALLKTAEKKPATVAAKKTPAKPEKKSTEPKSDTKKAPKLPSKA